MIIYFTIPVLILLTVPEPVVDEPGCYTDGDCPSKQACFDGECLNPCLHVQPCVQNAECAVKNELPLRVMVCTCKPGYTGKGDERCELISKLSICGMFGACLIFLPQQGAPIETGCRSDSDCPSSRACRNRACVNPCREGSPCATQAICSVKDHRAQCSCSIGFTGDGYSQCVPSKDYCYSIFCSFFNHFPLSS